MSALTSVTSPQDETAGEAAPGGTRRHHLYESLSSIAGLLAVIAGLFSLMAVSVAAIVSLPSGDGQNVVAVTTGSFGVKLGADGRQAAQHAQRTEAAKVQALAAQLDPEEANKALRETGQLIPPSR